MDRQLTQKGIEVKLEQRQSDGLLGIKSNKKADYDTREVIVVPGLITHCAFGEEVWKKLPRGEVKTTIAEQKTAYRLGLQGPDIFTYHIFLLMFKDSHNIASFMHENRTKAFFEAALPKLERMKPEERSICLAYISGFLCHFVSDSLCHPFVYARTKFNPSNPEFTYYGRHAELENVIDSYYAQQYMNSTFGAFPQKEIFQIPPFSKQVIANYLSDSLWDSCGDLWKKRWIAPGFVKSVLWMAETESKFLTDPSGSKKKVVKKIEETTMKKTFVSEKFINDQLSKIKDPLNQSGDIWYNSWKKDITSRESFTELFDAGIEKAAFFVSQADSPEKLLENLEPLSYHSGLLTE